MNYETKRNVFEEFADKWAGLDDERYEQYMQRYANALPDDLPVIPKEVSNIMITYRFLWWKEFLDKAYDNELDKELSEDDDINYRVRSESAEVARALILGAWRVEGTGEIVKLEEIDDGN